MRRLFALWLLVVLPVWALSESFNETLTLHPLVGGRVHASFAFEVASETTSLHHFGLLPRALWQPVVAQNVSELQLALTKGRWLYNVWGAPSFETMGDESVASGAEVWAAMSNEEEMWPRWRVLTSALASLSCASLDAIDEKTTIQPSHAYFTHRSPVLHAYLPSESVCTENISPLLKLLPCKGGAGLASLVKPHSILSAEFHSVVLHVERDATTWRMSLKVHAVMRPDTLGAHLWSFSDMFQTNLQSVCPIATSSRVIVHSDTEPQPLPAPVSMAAEEEDELLSDLLQEEEDDDEDMGLSSTRVGPRAAFMTQLASYTYVTSSLDAYDKELALQWTAPSDSLLLHPPPLQATRQVLGYGQEHNTVRLTLRNSLPAETVRVLYYDHIPSMFLPLLHTMQASAQVDEYDESDDMVRYADDIELPFVVAAKYTPPRLREHMGAMELTLRVPAGSTVTVTYTLMKHMLHYDEHVPDPHRGMDLPPALFMPLSGSFSWAKVHAPWPVARVQAARLYTSPSLLDMAAPDFSMPYNIILFYSTFVALFFGTLLNTLLRRFRDMYSPKKE